MEKTKLLEDFNIEKLVKETDHNAQIRILQEINEKLLTKYAIKVGDLTIIPLWVEAYYYHEEHFPDTSTHRSPKQKNHFGMLYQHAKTEINGGVDLCLSDSEDYFLSFLIKIALVNGEYCTQEKINRKLIETHLDDIESRDDFIIEYHRDGIIFPTQRIGLTNENFKGLPLAALPINKIKTYPFDNKEKIVKAYLDNLFREEHEVLRSKREEKCRELLGYRSSYAIGE